MTQRRDPALTGRLYAPVPVSTRDEKWRDAVGFEGRYLVSDKGRLYGLCSENYLRPIMTKKGYLRTSFRTHDKKNRYVGVHAQVAAAFIGPCPNGMEVNHKNGIKTDNRLDNLEYVTHSRNIKHSYDIGTSLPRQGNAKLSRADVYAIRKLCKPFFKTTKAGGTYLARGFRAKLASRFGVVPEYISTIARGGSWRCLP